jgi:hypothetical protein
MGIPLNAGQAASDLQSLAVRARSGDKQAQLQLGVMFEEGHGVSQSAIWATELYRMAASDSGGTRWIYVPSPGGNAPARTIPFDGGLAQKGLNDAKMRLLSIRNGGHQK